MDTDAYFQVMDAYKKWWRKQRKLSSAATLSETPLQTKHVSILVYCSKNITIIIIMICVFAGYV